MRSIGEKKWSERLPRKLRQLEQCDEEADVDVFAWEEFGNGIGGF